jgi:hypothetical protein
VYTGCGNVAPAPFSVPPIFACELPELDDELPLLPLLLLLSSPPHAAMPVPSAPQIARATTRRYAFTSLSSSGR